MANNEFNENDPLEQLLDQESDSEFGPAEIHEHLDENSQPLVLRNWSAQDFANIYVRFHPHVLRQAKRYLTNHSQAEEITQDAFLYLITSLPEVDSETGVLKLLKWKVRLLALAKLEPRQREALVASLYEEKTSSQVSAQLGLNENATRQLVFRAKAAFRKALVGEAETRGLTVSEIISVAARKASKDAGKYVSVASALLLVLAVTIGVLPNLATSPEQLNANTPIVATDLGASPESNAADSSAANSATEAEQADASSASSLLVPAEQLASSQPDNTGVDVDPGTSSTESAGSGVTPENSSSSSASTPNSAASASSAQLASFANSQASIDQSPFDPWLLDPLLGQETISATLLSGPAVVTSNSSTLLSIVSNQGLWADLQFQPSSPKPFQAVTVGIYVDGKQYFARVNQQDLIVLASDAKTETYVFVGSIGLLTDVSGYSYDNTRLDGGQVKVTITINNQSGIVTNTSLALAGRT